LEFTGIQKEIDDLLPVCVRVSWPDKSDDAKTGHFLTIYGYDVSPLGRNQLFLGDPYYGDSRVYYDVFLTRYQGCGTWTDTYLLNR
jgi:hypothetical protein